MTVRTMRNIDRVLGVPLCWPAGGILRIFSRHRHQATVDEPTKVLALLYTCIGFLPYSLFHVFDGKGLLTFLAYPRPILGTIMFGSALTFVLRSSHVYSTEGVKVQAA